MPTEAENIWVSAESRFRNADRGQGAEIIDLDRSIDTPSPESAIRPSPLERLHIQGGQALNGTIAVSGAKNAALKLMCASLLTDQPVELSNMPVTLGDMRTLAVLLKHIGVRCLFRRDGHVFLQAEHIERPQAPYDLVRKMRGSILVLGPMLARHGTADVSLPGGCAIGTRPVDFHIEGLRAMGADIRIEDGYIRARAPKGGLSGADYTFPKVSHTGTENLMMAATLAKGETVLRNAAREPEISDLADCLRAMGADIEGDGTDTIRIQGQQSLHGARHATLPDRIETGTWLIAAGMTGGELFLKNATLAHIAALLGPLKRAGIEITEDTDKGGIRARRKNGLLTGTDIMTEPYPGFPTDLQAQFMSMLTLCKGAGMVTETIFENRFMHVPELCRMGANITVQDHSAIIRGVDKLHGAEVMATDLRASVALVLAGLAAEGETILNRVYHLDRGYENIVEKLGNCGARISRKTEGKG